MSKKKSVAVTIIVSALLVVVAIAAYRLAMPVFIIITAVFGGVGFLSSASFFCSWLEQEPLREEDTVEPIRLEREPDLGADFTATYDEIKREVEAGL